MNGSNRSGYESTSDRSQSLSPRRSALRRNSPMLPALNVNGGKSTTRTPAPTRSAQTSRTTPDCAEDATLEKRNAFSETPESRDAFSETAERRDACSATPERRDAFSATPERRGAFSTFTATPETGEFVPASSAQFSMSTEEGTGGFLSPSVTVAQWLHNEGLSAPDLELMTWEELRSVSLPELTAVLGTDANSLYTVLHAFESGDLRSPDSGVLDLSNSFGASQRKLNSARKLSYTTEFPEVPPRLSRSWNASMPGSSDTASLPATFLSQTTVALDTTKEVLPQRRSSFDGSNHRSSFYNQGGRIGLGGHTNETPGAAPTPESTIGDMSHIPLSTLLAKFEESFAMPSVVALLRQTEVRHEVSFCSSEDGVDAPDAKSNDGSVRDDATPRVASQDNRRRKRPPELHTTCSGAFVGKEAENSYWNLSRSKTASRMPLLYLLVFVACVVVVIIIIPPDDILTAQWLAWYGAVPLLCIAAAFLKWRSPRFFENVMNAFNFFLFSLLVSYVVFGKTNHDTSPFSFFAILGSCLLWMEFFFFALPVVQMLAVALLHVAGLLGGFLWAVRGQADQVELDVVLALVLLSVALGTLWLYRLEDLEARQEFTNRTILFIYEGRLAKRKHESKHEKVCKPAKAFKTSRAFKTSIHDNNFSLEIASKYKEDTWKAGRSGSDPHLGGSDFETSKKARSIEPLPSIRHADESSELSDLEMDSSMSTCSPKHSVTDFKSFASLNAETTRSTVDMKDQRRSGDLEGGARDSFVLESSADDHVGGGGGGGAVDAFDLHHTLTAIDPLELTQALSHSARNASVLETEFSSSMGMPQPRMDLEASVAAAEETGARKEFDSFFSSLSFKDPVLEDDYRTYTFHSQNRALQLLVVGQLALEAAAGVQDYLLLKNFEHAFHLVLICRYAVGCSASVAYLLISFTRFYSVGTWQIWKLLRLTFGGGATLAMLAFASSTTRDAYYIYFIHFSRFFMAAVLTADLSWKFLGPWVFLFLCCGLIWFFGFSPEISSIVIAVFVLVLLLGGLAVRSKEKTRRKAFIIDRVIEYLETTDSTLNSNFV